MGKQSLKSRLTRWAITLAVGGSAMQVSGCDPTVRDTLLTGLEATTNSLIDTLVSAFFISLDNEDNPDGGVDGGDTGLTTT